VVIVRSGTNDVFSLAPRTTDFDALMAAVRANVPRAKVVLITLRHFARYPDTDANVSAWNAHIRTLTPSFGAAVVDLENDPQRVSCFRMAALHAPEFGRRRPPWNSRRPQQCCANSANSDRRRSRHRSVAVVSPLRAFV